MSGQWLGVTDAAAALGISDRTLRRRIAGGDVTSQVHNGRRLVYVPQELPRDAWARPAAPQTPCVAIDISDAFEDDLAEELEVEVPPPPPPPPPPGPGPGTALARPVETTRAVLAAADHLVGRVERDLRRARRLGIAGWIAAAILTLAGGAGLYAGSRIVAEYQTEAAVRDAMAGITDERLRASEARAQEMADRNDDLVVLYEDEIARLNGEIDGAVARLAESGAENERLRAQVQALQQRDDLPARSDAAPSTAPPRAAFPTPAFLRPRPAHTQAPDQPGP